MKTNQFSVTLGLTKFALRASLRNRGSLIFSLVFPIIFISIFGLLSSGSSQTKIGISDDVNQNSPLAQAVRGFAEQKDSPIKLVQGSRSSLELQLKQSNLGAVLEPGEDPNLSLITSNNDPQSGAVAAGILSGIINQLNLRSAGVTNPPFSLPSHELSGRPYHNIDFVLPGQIGFSLISIATFGVAFPFLTLRKTLVLKRIFATGVKPLAFIVSQGLSRSVQAVFQVAILIIFGILVFHFDLANGVSTFFGMLTLATLAVIAFMGFGLLISNLAKDEQTLPIAINLFTFPQIFLSGVFFPTTGLPLWLQEIGNNLPLGYLNLSMRHVANDGSSLFIHEVWPYLLGLLAWSAVAYYLAARTFKSE